MAYTSRIAMRPVIRCAAKVRFWPFASIPYLCATAGSALDNGPCGPNRRATISAHDGRLAIANVSGVAMLELRSFVGCNNRLGGG